MRKILFSFLAAMLSFVTVSALTVTVSLPDYQAPSFTTPEGIQFIADKATGSSAPKYFANDKGVRMYPNNTLTILCDSAITSVVFTLTSDPTDITASVGACVTDAEAKTVTWTGEADSIVLTVGAKTISGTSNGRLNYSQVVLQINADTLVAPVDTTEIDTVVVEPIVISDTLTVAKAIELVSDLAQTDTTAQTYAVAGYVTRITTAYSEKHNNITFYLADEKDGKESIQAFRAVPQTTADSEVAEGDKVIAVGRLMNYKGTTPEILFPEYSIVEAAAVDTLPADTTIVEPGKIEAISVAEFLDKADTETTYQLTGVVANIKSTLYGNFDLVDGDASVYIYGLLNAAGEAKQFASMDIEEGDTLTLQGVYVLFKNTPEIANALYISHVKAVKDTLPADTTIVEPGKIEAISVAEFLDKADTETTYQLTGVVANIKSTTYGNFDLVEGDASVYIYGLLTAAGEAKQFASMDIEEGDTLTLQGVYVLYKNTPEIVDALYISHVKAVKDTLPADTTIVEPGKIEAISIAEFLDKADTETTYQLTGVVANIKNTTYGNFDLVDGDASVYIYGLLTAEGEAKQFASMDIEEGDTLTLQGVYVLYKNTPEIVDALYISHKKLSAGLELVASSEIVAVQDGQLAINAQGLVQVYNVAGQLLYSNVANGQLTVSGIQRGQMLIVRVSDKVAKIVL